ncbi:GNAT family N-acetyltransferase [Flavobacterium pallidum]|uniref:N-acetyltransferase n=1 Tax=Flavobacterium pallidum TaxID=2172098 RepID=A0A2S1SIV4_9FLAO|nr:GNAT family protein [Flavobacterium pallidum]AWI26330.1 N-acetyltransferase [Flavobacterium pallidum]
MKFNFDNDIILENDILILRPLSLADTGNLLQAALSDSLLLQYSPKQVYNESLLTEYIQSAIDLRTNRQRYSFSIFSKRDNRYIGSTAFLNISNTDDRLEIGATWIDKTYQGTGLNSHCKYLLLEYAFEVIHANKVEFRTDARNIPSRKAIEKIGGKFEGILREHLLMPDGFRRNSCCYGIVRSEWESVKLQLKELL